MITRAEKEKIVGEFNKKFSKAEAAFVTAYQGKGISVEEMTALRSALRGVGVELKVLRNTLASLAVKGTPYEVLTPNFKGAIAIAISYKDSAGAAKVLTKFAKEQPIFELRAAALGSRALTVADIKSLAELPGKNELIAMFMGGLKSVPTGLACALSGVPRKLLYALNAVKASKEGASAA